MFPPPVPHAALPPSSRGAEQRGMVAVCLAGAVVVLGSVVRVITHWMVYTASSQGSMDQFRVVNFLDSAWTVLALALAGAGLGLGLSALIGPRSTRARVLGALATGVCGYALITHLVGLGLTMSTSLFD
ncbi:hypothetical protein [Cellulomonas denverensis]|uniref:Uncharacterized protein n=1 Tax=Cellulomonas denverensis TaxID=264297 RepID=A0A7X6KUT1_9CELL|nr:hypothetical protein [Cellulomonas denverensis]NKY22470.1 hypothetical protein [Cellulomonas denverensis]GIG25943.1 hypothetical protein Cde04nite_21870 [Cellulomonas denverensis]